MKIIPFAGEIGDAEDNSPRSEESLDPMLNVRCLLTKGGELIAHDERVIIDCCLKVDEFYVSHVGMPFKILNFETGRLLIRELNRE